ncbi:MAG: S-adenosylmethionine:tRNA ribosyltransferase-isomerase [Polyangiales bacterium]
MQAAHAPRDETTTRLLVVDPALREIRDAGIGELASFVSPGDVVVVNDAATLPASLRATLRGERVEVRLVSGDASRGKFRAILFDDGDHRTPTERRRVPSIATGDTLIVGDATATVTAVEGRLIDLAFDRVDAPLLSTLYAIGRPIQYAHVPLGLDLWSVQTVYASRPWAFEMPSAGRPLRAATIDAIRARGADVVAITHAAGISSTGDEATDAKLPLPERYEISADAARSISEATRVIAIGTSVVRALEGCFAQFGEIRPVSAVTDFRLGPHTVARVVDAVLSGLHEPGTSHFELLSAFAPPALLERAHAHATARGYLGHELGDAVLVLPIEEVSSTAHERHRLHRRHAA